MIKRFHLILSINLLACFFNVAYASVADNLTELLNGIRTMQSNFKQTVYDNHGKAIQNSKGKMALQRPGKFRWDVENPIPQLIIANDKKIMIYDPDLQQVTIRPMDKATGETPALLLSDVNTSIGKTYTITSLPPKKNLESFELVPKKEDSMFASIEMSFSAGKILYMNLQDHLGHTTKIQFLSPKTNVSLASSLFSMKPPAGADVVDETKRR